MNYKKANGNCFWKVLALGLTASVLCYARPAFGQPSGTFAPVTVTGSQRNPSAPVTVPGTEQPKPVPPSEARAGENQAGSAPAATFTRNMDGLNDRQKLGVGDRITFRVLEDQEDAKLLTVTDAGQVDVPELGLVNAAGKSCKALAYEIKSKLEQTTYFKATVMVGVDLLNKTVSGRKVYVVGQVRTTGPQEIPAGETWTVSRAVMQAGGFTNFADKKRVRLVRGGGAGKAGQTIFVNVSEVWEKGRTDLDPAVEPEDFIYVPARAVNFY